MSKTRPAPDSVKSSEPVCQRTCLICASADVGLLRDDDAEHALTPTDVGSSRKRISHGRILRCRNCGFGFRAYRPTDEELAGLYRAMDPAVYEGEATGRLRTARRHLAIVQRYISRGKLLDVGCASGSFLHCAAEAGFEVVGVEPSTVLSAKAREKLRGQGTVLCSSLQDIDLPVKTMDILTLWDVLEHVKDPLSFLQHCTTLVKADGYIIANVPDLGSWQAHMFGKRWPLLLAEHLNYFSRKSLVLAGNAVELQALNFGRRPASFTLEYVLYRLAQHNFPIAALGHSLAKNSFLGTLSIPVYLGESYVVWGQINNGRRNL